MSITARRPSKTLAAAVFAVAMSAFAALPAAAQNSHCYEFEPHIQKWLKNKPDNAEYVPMPAVFRKSWEFHARAYYTFEALGLVEKAHVDFFDSIHRDRKFKQNDQTPQALGEWAEQYGVKKEDVVSAYESFAVDTKVRQAKKSVFGYEVTGVPAIVIDGKYRTSGSMAGSYEELLKVINFLVSANKKNR